MFQGVLLHMKWTLFSSRCLLSEQHMEYSSIFKYIFHSEGAAQIPGKLMGFYFWNVIKNLWKHFKEQ